jgi:hypothetical protein
VDPFDHPDAPVSGLVHSEADLARVRLGEIRSRITELDSQVAGLLARREQLTRAAFDLAGTVRMPRTG